MAITLNGTTGITTPDVTSDGLTVDSTTLVVDEANNRVGVGTSSPSSKLHLSGAATADARITLTQTTAGLTSTLQQGSTGVALSAAGSQALLFDTNGIERMRIDSAGTVILNQGQIQFPATQNASSNGNTLDDYEEGTWSPGFGNLGTVTLNYARYTKIGNTVTAMCSFSCTSTPTANSSLFSLPFVSNGFSAGAWTRSTLQGGQLESQNSNTNCYFATTAASSSGSFYTTIVYQVA